MKSFEITFCIASLALSGALTGCVPVRPQPPNSFLPPPPRAPQQRTIVSDPPEIAASSALDDATVAIPQVTPHPSRVEQIVREAEWHYQLGRKQYQDGDLSGARREFDRAIDVLLTAPDTASGLRPLVDQKLEELIDAIYKLDLGALGAADTGEPAYEKSPLEDIPQLTFPVDPKLKNKVLEEVRATASQLPLQVNDPVLSYINYFSTERGRKILLFGLRRAGRYKPLIQRILDEEGVPQELIFVAQLESAFLPRAVSRKRAVGMWQFAAARGVQYGLERTPYRDDRLDPELATRAAARHLRDLYHRYGDWYLALVAYNAGPGVVDGAVERTGYADFWEWRRRSVLPKETINYVPVILAMTIMAKNAKEYGLENIDADPPLEYDTVRITAPASLTLVGDVAECPVSQIRDLNPALLKDVAPAGTLRVPKGTGNAVAAVLALVPAEKRLAWRAHRVAEAETLASIARRFHVTEASLASVNPTLSAEPEIGSMLVIPAPPRPVTVARRHVRHSSKLAANARGPASTVAKQGVSAKKRTRPARASAKAPAHKTSRTVSYQASNAKPRSKTVR